MYIQKQSFREIATGVIGRKERSNLYLNSKVKEEARKILSQYGLSLSDAVNIFLTQVVLERGIPFKICIPNETTRKVLKEVREGKNIEEISLESLASEVKQGVNF